MLESGKIGKNQFFVLVTLYTVSYVMLIIPGIAATESRQDAWIGVLAATLVGVALTLLYIRLSNRYPDRTLVQMILDIFGKTLGWPVALFYVVFMLMMAGGMIWEVGYFITTHILVRTPIQAVQILLLSIVVMAVRLGLEPFVRTGEILFPWVLVLFSMPILFLLPQVEPDNLMPVLHKGWKPVARTFYTVSAIPFMEHFVLLMVLPFVSERKGLGAVFAISTLVGGFILFLTTLFCLLVLGDQITAHHVFPSFVLAKQISIGRFIERIEVIVAGMWFLTIFVKTALCLYGAALGTAQLFRLRSYRPLVYPMAFILVPLSIAMMPNIPFFKNVVMRYIPFYDWILGLFIPLLLLLVAALRRNR